MTEQVMVVCIDCPSLIPKGIGTRRCAPCRTAHNRRKNSTPAAKARQASRQRGLVGHCACCQTYGKLTVDHIVALVRGGSTDAANIQYLCQPCNSSKGAGDFCGLDHEKSSET